MMDLKDICRSCDNKDTCAAASSNRTNHCQGYTSEQPLCNVCIRGKSCEGRKVTRIIMDCSKFLPVEDKEKQETNNHFIVCDNNFNAIPFKTTLSLDKFKKLIASKMTRCTDCGIAEVLIIDGTKLINAHVLTVTEFLKYNSYNTIFNKIHSE